MGARSGNNYLSALRRLKAEIWRDGECVIDPTVAAGLVHPARTIASLYDLQMEHPEAMTYRLPEGGRAGLSFLQPTIVEQVARRGAMFRTWAEYTEGMMAYSPARANSAIAAMAAAADSFDGPAHQFKENLQSYYRAARDHDWCSSLATSSQLMPLRIEERRTEGVIISGAAVASAGPLVEELLVLPAEFEFNQAGESNALIFAINCNAAGLKLLCQAPASISRLDRPLAARFGPPASLCWFERVMVPRERVFSDCDLERSRALIRMTRLATDLLHDEVVRLSVYAEFFIGVVVSIAQALDIKPSAIETQTRQLLGLLAAIRSELHHAELQSTADSSGRFVPANGPLESARAHCTELNRRSARLIRSIAGDDLAGLPSEADLRSAPLAEVGATITHKIALLRLAREILDQMPRVTGVESSLDIQPADDDDQSTERLAARVVQFLNRR